MQSDDLLGLLEQITAENNSDTDEPSTPTGPCLQQQTSTSTSASTVVGPTTAELESLNELIKFDHVYYKVTSPAGLVMASSSPPISSGGAVVSVVRQQSPSNQRLIKPKQEEEQPLALTTTQVVDTSRSSVPTIQIPDIAFSENLSRENLDRLLDLDSILEEDLKHNDTVSPRHMMASLEPASFPNTVATRGCNTVSKNSLTIPTTTGLQSRKRKFSNSYNSEFNIKYSVSPRNQRLGFDEVLDLSPFADSNYCSDLSDVASPRSDSSSLLGEDGWEESFTELFPSLM